MSDAAGRTFVFAGGGTGGHLFPALAVAEQLKDICPSSGIVFFATERPLDAAVLRRAGYELRAQRITAFPANPLRWPAFYLRWRSAVRTASRWLQALPAAVVVGCGGYAAAPAVIAASRAGLPVAVLNPDAVPGRANRFLASYADAIFCQWPVTQARFSNSANVLVTGCPVRRAFFQAARRQGLELFALQADRQTLLITGASQGSANINRAMIRCVGQLGDFASRWQVLHLAGSRDEAFVSRATAHAPLPYRVVGFTDRMDAAMAAADLVVARAGASTLAEITAVGRPAVLLPYPYHRDKHQYHNARVLVDVGAAVVVDDFKAPDATARRLLPILRELMSDPARRGGMATAAASLARPQAARDVARHLLRLAGAGDCV